MDNILVATLGLLMTCIKVNIKLVLGSGKTPPQQDMW